MIQRRISWHRAFQKESFPWKNSGSKNVLVRAGRFSAQSAEVLEVPGLFFLPRKSRTYSVFRVVIINSGFCSAQHRSSAVHEFSLSGLQFFFQMKTTRSRLLTGWGGVRKRLSISRAGSNSQVAGPRCVQTEVLGRQFKLGGRTPDRRAPIYR